MKKSVRVSDVVDVMRKKFIGKNVAQTTMQESILQSSVKCSDKLNHCWEMHPVLKN